jgi:hypothetical protein
LQCRGDWIRTSDLLNPIQESQHSNTLSGQEVTSSPADRCTSGCTSDAETNQTPTVEALAAALGKLSAADRARLAALLLGQQPEQGERTA